MGTKYIIEVEDKPFELLNEDGFTSEKLYRVKGFNSLVFDWNGLNMLMPYTEPDLEQIRKEAYEKGYETAKHEREDCPKQAYTDAIRMEGYQKGLSDAWECARKIVLPGDVSGIYLADLEEIFDRSSLQDVIKDYSASECIEKIRQYEQEKKEIKVGDEVISPDGKGVVTEISDRIVRIMYPSGSGYIIKPEELTKTGRHFPEIAEVLAKMKESDNG